MTTPKGQSKQSSSSNKPADHGEYQQVHDYSPMGVLGMDAAGIITYANVAALLYLDLGKQDVLGRYLFDIYQDTTNDRINESKLLKQEEITDREFTVKASPEKERWALVSSKVYKDKNGKVETYLFIRDISALKKKEKLFSYLNKAAEELAKARDTQSALDQISRFIVPKFANWFSIDLLKEDRMELLLLKHEDPEKIKWAYEYRSHYPTDLNSNTGTALVLKTGKPSFVPVITDEMVEAAVTDPVQRKAILDIGLQSVITVAMSNKDRNTGVVSFISSTPGRYFDETDLDFAQNFASLIGLALDNTRLNEEAANELILRKQSEEQFRFLLDAIPHKMWTSAPDGRATFYNKGWYDYTGINDFEKLREQIWNLIHPDDLASAAEQWPVAVKTGISMDMEHRFRRKDGEYRWHLSRFSAHKDENGQIILWVGTSTDIHEQKLADLELSAANEELTSANEELAAVNEELASTNEELAAVNEELATTNEELNSSEEELQTTVNELVLAKEQVEASEQLFRSIAVNIPKSLIIVIGKDHRFITVEGDLMVKMGFDSKNYTGKHPAEVGPPERYYATRELYDRVLAGEQFNEQRTGATGEIFSVDFVPLKNDKGEVYAGLIIALEITEIKQAEEKSAKLAAIVESSDDAIIGKTLEGIVTSWNNAAERMFGYNGSEMIGQSILKLIPEERHHEEPHILGQLRNGIRLEHFETQRMTKDKKMLDVSLTVSPIKDSRGNIIGISKIARDITERKRDELRKSDFIGMVSHELKTPLTSLTALIQVANSKLKNSEDTFLSGALAKANIQVKKMSAMINGFLNISRLESGKILIEKQIFDLTELIVEIIDETELTVSTHEFRFEQKRPIIVNTDRDKIGSVITNLLTNAVKYSPKGKVVEIKCEVLKNEIQVSIHDNGIGIRAEDQEKLFDRYYRVETTNTQHISGFGIGLYLSAEIIQRHDGKIWVKSEPGKGSTFYFSLPTAGK